MKNLYLFFQICIVPPKISVSSFWIVSIKPRFIASNNLFVRLDSQKALLHMLESGALFRRNWEISAPYAIWLFWGPNDPSKLFALIQMKFEPCQQVLKLLIDHFQAPFRWVCWCFGHQLKSMVVPIVWNHRHVLCLL